MSKEAKEKVQMIGEWVTRLILLAMSAAGWMVARQIDLAISEMAQVKQSINTLNTNMAVVVNQLAAQSATQQDHEVRIRTLEHGQQK